MCLCRVNRDSSPNPASSGLHRWLLCSQRSPGPWTGSPLQSGCRTPLSLCLMILLQISGGSNLDRSINCCCLSGIIQKVGTAISWRTLSSNASVCSQWKHLFIRMLSQKGLKMQTLISEPTPLLLQQNLVLIGQQSAGKTSQIPAPWNYFPFWYIKRESLAGNGGGGGPEGEDLNTVEEINCRLLVVLNYGSSGELQKEFGVGLGSAEGFTHSQTVNPLSLWLLLCAAIMHSMHPCSCTQT